MYAKALQYLESLAKFGIRPGLDRIEALMKLMGNPERKYRTIHVTGSNGKGSTTAFIASILQSSGIRTAMFTSPHLESYTERMVIDDERIGEEDFARAIDHVRIHVENMLKLDYEQPTEFEVLTAAALWYFAEQEVEYAVIEVGMGGLLDSTNVIWPQVSVITNVALEHTDRCGGTIAEIAEHKAGIVKLGTPVVTAAKAEALNIIFEKTELLHARLYQLGRDFFVQLKAVIDKKQGLVFRSNEHGNFVGLKTTLIGEHQAENCGCAIMTAHILSLKDSRITPRSIVEGVNLTRWAGRFEYMSDKPDIIVDGAHNLAGATALRAALDEQYKLRPIIFVFCVLAVKDVSGMWEVLFRPVDSVIVTAPLSYRAATADDVAAQIKAERVETAPTIEEAIKRAIAWAGEDGAVCVCGSLYLIGTARAKLLEML